MALNQGCSGQKMSHKLCFCQFWFFCKKKFFGLVSWDLWGFQGFFDFFQFFVAFVSFP